MSAPRVLAATGLALAATLTTASLAAATGGTQVQPITFTMATPSAPVIGGSYPLSAVTGSGQVVSYYTTTSTVCVYTDYSDGTATLYFNGAGDCVIQADVDGDATYAPAEAKLELTVAKANQVISFPAPHAMRLGGSDQRMRATASSGLPVSYTDRTPRICGLSGALVHARRIGTCTIVAHQAGDANRNPAPALSRSFQVTR